MPQAADVFTNGVAVITGAGSGIGAGLARRAAALGMHVIVADLDVEAAQAVVSQIEKAGGQGEALFVDVSRPEAMEGLADHVFSRHGAVRLLINNAGIETIGFSWEISAERWEKTLNTNIHGVVHGVRAFLPAMLKSGADGWIGNLASVGAFGAMPAQTAYIMTKHAIQSFTECLALELQAVSAPVRVSSIIPGLIRTGIFRPDVKEGSASAEHHRAIMAAMADAHGMDPDEAADIILSGMAEGRFWVHTHPETSEQMIAARIAFLKDQAAPVMPDLAQIVLNGHEQPHAST